MNDIEETLRRAVTARATVGVHAIAERAALRRRRRRLAAGSAAVVILLAGFSFFADSAVDDPPVVQVVREAPDPSRFGPAEGPVGADMVRGELDDTHVEAVDLRGLTDCADHVDAGFPDPAEVAAGEAVIEALREAGLHEQPFVTSSSGGQSVEGIPAVGLSRRYGPTLDFIASNVEPGQICVDLPRVGAYNEAPDLAPIELMPLNALAPDGVVGVVVGDGCVPKAVWQATIVRELSDRVEIGHLLGRSDGLAWPADCELPQPITVSVPAGLRVTEATSPETMAFGTLGRGGSGTFTFDPANLVGDPETMGDDLIAQNVDDPSIQFQVSDVFGEIQVSSTTRPVFTDQWPVTGEGRIGVPSVVPAGFYQVHFIHHPEINGVLNVLPSEGGGALPAPTWGWRIPDLDGNGRTDVIAGTTGHVLLSVGDGYLELIGDSGAVVGVRLEGDRVFTCGPDDTLVQQWHEPAGGDEIAIRLAYLVIEDGIGVWQPEPSFFFTEPVPALPARGQGCERFGTPPTDVAVADGVISDVHVEAIDMVFPECGNPFTAPPLPADRDAELTAIYDRLVADGLLDPLAYFSTSMGRGPDGIMIGLYRRYGPTVSWLAERVAADDLCFLPPPLLPPVGAFTGPPGLLEWRFDGTPPGPDETSFRVVNAAQCGLVYPDEQLLPPQVAEFEDRVEIALPIRPRFGPSRSPCFAPDVFDIELREPLGDREIVPASTPETMRFSPDMAPIPTDTPITVVFDPVGIGDETTIGDDMMIQGVADPSIQIQVSGVFTDDPTAGPPAPIVTDRWAPTGVASLVIPAGTPPGRYTYMFIEHPQFNGSFTLG